MFGCNFSMLNYDTVAGGVFGSLRLGWNAGMMHASVYPSLFTYPAMGFGGFTPYQQYTTSDWLLDPGFALQTTFMSMQNYGCFGGGMVAPQSPLTTLGNLTITTKTAEEKAQEEELNNLKAVAKEVVKNLDGDAKTKLQEAIDKNDGTPEEKITALETVLKADGVKAQVENVLLNNPPSGIKVDSKTLASILKGDGVHLISDIQNSKITDMNTYAKRDNGITENEVTLLPIGKNNVLDFIEGLETFDLINGKNTELFDKLTSSLKDLAEEVENNADIDSNLKDKVVEYRGKEISTLDDFKKLYAAVLLAVSELADRKLEEATGDALDGIVADDFYTTKAKEVLTEKGVTEDIITSIQATPGASTDEDTPDASTDQDTPDASTDQDTPDASTDEDTPDASTTSSNPGKESEEYKPTTVPVKIDFGTNKELQKAHNATALVIAEALDRIDSDKLTCKITTSGKYGVDLKNGNFVAFELDNTGDIKNIWVSHDDNSENNNDIMYRMNNGSFEVSCKKSGNSHIDFESIAEGDFDALADALKPFIPAVQKAEAKRIIDNNDSFDLHISNTSLKEAYPKAKEVLLKAAKEFDKVTFHKDSTDKKIWVMLGGKNILCIVLNDDKTLSSIQIEYGANDCSRYFDSKIEFSTNKFMAYSDNDSSSPKDEEEVNKYVVEDIKAFAQLLVDKYRTTQAS